jgi:hypothetical protein
MLEQLQEIWQKNLDSIMSSNPIGNLGESIKVSIQDWSISHPFSAWLLTHPLLTILLLLIGWLLFKGMIRAIGDLSERIWLTILESPVRLIKLLLRKIGFNNKKNLNFIVDLSGDEDKEKRLFYIVNRLENIKKEQDELWKEITTLLNLK